jgi:hypothetical protein
MPDPDLTGTSANYDWGIYNPISNGGNQAGLWRTLATDEWVYVFNTRSASMLGGTANARFAKATVNGIGGVILFPDVYTHPNYLPIPLQINNAYASLTINSFSGDAWMAMEDLGCVFLPAAGARGGNSISYLGSGGYYRSVSFCNQKVAYYLNFSSGNCNPQEAGQSYNNFLRCGGLSVRLVQDY